MYTEYRACFNSYKESIVGGRGECWLNDVDGIESVERRTLASGMEGGSLKEFGAQRRRRRGGWSWTLCEQTAKALKNEGRAVGELHDRLSKAVTGMEKGGRAAEKSFAVLQAIEKQGKLSPASLEAMKTLGDNIKARLHRAHRYSICYDTHTDVTSILL